MLGPIERWQASKVMVNYLSFKTRLDFVFNTKLQVMAIGPQNNIL